MNNPLISIIIPVYNVEQYLNRCVESVISQSYKNIEVILVDDGSPDNCPVMCDEWAAKDNRIKIVHKANGGVSSARNAGIELASGEWIWFVDSDDYINENSLEQLSSKIGSKIDLIVFNKNIDLLYQKDEEFFYKHYFKYHFGFEPWNKLYKKSIISDNNLRFDIEEKIGEDLLFNIMYYNFANTYLFVNKDYYNYVDRSDSAMHKEQSIRFEQQMRLFAKMNKLYEKYENNEILCQLFIMHFISGLNQSKMNLSLIKTRKLFKTTISQYGFSKKTILKSTNNFCKSENASFLGTARMFLIVL